MNPEFKRNLLLELSVQRMITMPGILLLIFAAVNLIGGADSVTSAAKTALIVILVLWGTRLAADSVLSEVAGLTWDAQRMSSIGPVAMSWAKVLGSTIYVWYGALWCAAAYFYGSQGSADELLRIVLIGLFCHAIALFVSLLFHRLRPERMRFQVTMVQGIAVFAAAVSWRFVNGQRRDIDWYGFNAPYDEFTLVSAVVFLAWAYVGVYRLMRAELQFRSWPLFWFGFVSFAIFYAAGFPAKLSLENIVVAEVRGVEGIVRSLWSFVLAAGLTWIAAFAEPKGFVRLRKWGVAIAGRQPARIMEATPPWVLSLGIAMVFALALMLQWAVSEDAQYLLAGFNKMESVGAFAIAVMLFLIRDIGVIHLLTLDGRSKRGHMAALVYFAALYVIVPLIAGGAGAYGLLHVFLPVPYGHPAVMILPVFIQVVAVAGLLVWRWRVVARAMAAGAPARQ